MAIDSENNVEGDILRIPLLILKFLTCVDTVTVPSSGAAELAIAFAMIGRKNIKNSHIAIVISMEVDVLSVIIENNMERPIQNEP